MYSATTELTLTDGAHFWLLRIRSAHLSMHAKTEIFLRGLKLRGKSRSWQGLFEIEKKIRGNYAFFRIKVQYGKKIPYIVLYFGAF